MEQSLQALGCMEHRGACSADNDSGDGAGVMTQIPWDFFKKEIPELKPETTGWVVLISVACIHLIAPGTCG